MVKYINFAFHHVFELLNAHILWSSMQQIYGQNSRRSPYIIGASLSEPHINGTAMREFYIIIIIIIIMVRRSREIIYPVMLYGYKCETFYCAFSCLGHGPYIRRSNLANCKFTLELVLLHSLVPRPRPKIVQGPAKNTIKID